MNTQPLPRLPWVNFWMLLGLVLPVSQPEPGSGQPKTPPQSRQYNDRWTSVAAHYDRVPNVSTWKSPRFERSLVSRTSARTRVNNEKTKRMQQAMHHERHDKNNRRRHIEDEPRRRVHRAAAPSKTNRRRATRWQRSRTGDNAVRGRRFGVDFREIKLLLTGSSDSHQKFFGRSPATQRRLVGDFRWWSGQQLAHRNFCWLSQYGAWVSFSFGITC